MIDRSKLRMTTSTLTADRRVNGAPHDMIVDNPSVSSYMGIINNMQH
jgi:hypothetical protein